MVGVESALRAVCVCPLRWWKLVILSLVHTPVFFVRKLFQRVCAAALPSSRADGLVFQVSRAVRLCAVTSILGT